VLLNKTEANQTVELGAPGLKVAMKKVSVNETEGMLLCLKLLKILKIKNLIRNAVY
jgi:hypothetical protein